MPFSKKQVKSVLISGDIECSKTIPCHNLDTAGKKMSSSGHPHSPVDLKPDPDSIGSNYAQKVMQTKIGCY